MENKELTRRGYYQNCRMRYEKGYFVISGNTYPYRDELREDGFEWAPKTKVWYKRDPNYSDIRD